MFNFGNHIIIRYSILEFNIYTEEVMLKAHYHMSDKCTIKITPIDNQDIVEILLESNELSVEELEKQFKYYVSQEKIKRILYNENHRIKELIVEHAFKPVLLRQVL